MAGEGVARRSVDATTPGFVAPAVPIQHWCPVCGCRLDKADRPCPFGPHSEDAA